MNYLFYKESLPMLLIVPLWGCRATNSPKFSPESLLQNMTYIKVKQYWFDLK